jgi:hypothetical protein
MISKSFCKHLVVSVLLVRYGNSWRVYICATCQILQFLCDRAPASYCLWHTAVYRCSLHQLMGRTKLKGCVVSMLRMYACYYLWWDMKGIIYLQIISTWGILLTQTQLCDTCLVLCTFQETFGTMRCVSIWINREQNLYVTSHCVYSVLFC